MGRLIWIYDVFKNLSLSPVAVKELKGKKHMSKDVTQNTKAKLKT